jgi:hypothetical protein
MTLNSIIFESGGFFYNFVVQTKGSETSMVFLGGRFVAEVICWIHVP